MQELREALSKYVEQLTKNAQNESPPEGLDQQNQQLSQKDLDQMMKNLDDMMKAGSRDQAQQMLSQLRDLLEKLQSGQVSKQEAERGQKMQKKLDELGGLVGQQQRLMDETYRENRKPAQPGGTMPGEGGQQQQAAGRQAGPGHAGPAGPERPAGQKGQGRARRGRAG